jgi:opacity protein-like surface antigen
MKKLFLAAATSAVLLTSATSSFAGEDQFYALVEGGLSMLVKVTDKPTGVKLKPNTGGIIGLGVGYYLNDMIRGDLTLDFLLNPSFKKSGAQGVIKDKGKVTSLLVNGYVDFWELDKFKFFAGTGIGMAQVKETINYSGYSSAKTKKATNFAYQLSAGASAEISDGITVQAAYSWRDYGKTKAITVTGGGNAGSTKYRGNTILAGIRFDM